VSADIASCARLSDSLLISGARPQKGHTALATKKDIKLVSGQVKTIISVCMVSSPLPPLNVDLDPERYLEDLSLILEVLAPVVSTIRKPLKYLGISSIRFDKFMENATIFVLQCWIPIYI
jgi:hypothetical protein